MRMISPVKVTKPFLLAYRLSQQALLLEKKYLGLGILYVLVCVFGLMSCATLKSSSPRGQACIGDSESQKLLSQLEPSIRTLSGSHLDPNTPQMIFEACWKRVYQLHAYRVVVYRNPRDPAGDLLASAGLPKVRELEPSACLAKAEQSLAELQVRFAPRLIDQYRGLNPEWWPDPDVGPVKWLPCTSRQNPQTNDLSLPTFLHEMTHGLQKDNCLYAAFADRYLCFELDRDLPKRAVASLAEFPTTQPGVREAFARVQKIYLTEHDQPPITLFDELNAYIVSTQVLTRLLETRGPRSLYEGQARTAVFLPLFLVYTLKYLEVVRIDFGRYQRNFGRGAGNWESLETLLHEGEKAYQTWQVSLRRHGLSELEIERNLWGQYLQLRARLYLSN